MRSRRDNVVPTIARRGELPQASPPGGYPSRGFLRELHEFDSGVELYWHPPSSRWVLMRRRGRLMGGTPSSADLLVKEAVLQGPGGEFREPGGWLLDRLRHWDITRRGSVDPARAGYEFQQKIRAEEAEEDARSDALQAEATGRLGEDLWFAARGRASIVSDWESGKNDIDTGSAG